MRTGAVRSASALAIALSISAYAWAQAPIEARTTPEPVRPSLATLIEPLWIDLTDTQQNALEPFAPEWNTWPTAEKKS
ncbi:MAG: hypothetical protein ABIP08_05410, partial [Lautropia sp.]